MTALLLALPSSAFADTLVDNLDGITLDAQGQVARFDAILIGNDGRIVQVLARGDKRPGKVDYRVDGRRQIALPGLIDSHVRLKDLGFSLLVLDLSDVGSLREAQLKVGAYAAAHPERPWIVGAGWNRENWDQRELPTAADLDAVVASRPVWLVSADGHAGWANSLALKAAGVSALTKDPDGGQIVRGAAKAPTGVLLEGAMALIDKTAPSPRPEDRDLALLKAQEALLARGVTAVTDMGTAIEDWQAYRRAGDSGALRLRIMAYADGIDAMMLIGGPGPTPWLYDDRLRLNGVVLRVDGSLGSRGALLKSPYADDAKANGVSLLADTQLKNLMSRAAFDNFQIAVEANGDAAVARALDGIEAVAETYKGERRWRIENAMVIDPADAPRLGKSRVVVSMEPQQLLADQRIVESRLGTARLAGAFAWKAVTETGATLAFGSAAPARGVEPFAGIAAAITRSGADGEPFGGWQPQQRLTREAALAAYTTGAAYAGFAEGRFGRIAVGQRADFVLVDRDPLLATPDELRATRVLETWIGGQLVYRADEQSPAPRSPGRAGR